MILYCDTSALIKLLVREPGSDRMHQASSEAEAIGVCRIPWAEAMAAMARRQREDSASSTDLEQARQLPMPLPCAATTACSLKRPMS